MSFTISHVAAILPIVAVADRIGQPRAAGRHVAGARANVNESGLPTSKLRDFGLRDRALSMRIALIAGLTIGSMIPDSEKLTPIFRARVIEARLLHDPIGFLLVGMPLCWLAAWFISYAIPALNRAVGVVPKTDIRLVAPRTRRTNIRFGLGSLIGGMSHLALDSFTHGFGFVTHHVATMSHVVTVAGRQMEVWKLLWILTSAIGIVMVGVALMGSIRKLRWTRPDWTRLGVLGISTAGAFLIGFTREKTRHQRVFHSSKFGFLFATGVFFLTLSIYIILDKLQRAESQANQNARV